MNQPIPFSANLPNLALLCLFYLITIFPPFCHSISIDNDIIGEPDIECLDQEIRVWIKTRKYFQGRMLPLSSSILPFIQGEYMPKGRRMTRNVPKMIFQGKGQGKFISIWDWADVEWKVFDRSLTNFLQFNPFPLFLQFDPRGMYYGITLVISFHPMFITKVDQAFHVKCFFEEANRGLTAELGVR